LQDEELGKGDHQQGLRKDHKELIIVCLVKGWLRYEHRSSRRPSATIFLNCTSKVLLTATHLAFKDARETNIYNDLKSRNFIHTLVLDDVFVCETGMATELDSIFQFFGWSSFASITELGSKLLTIDFLCTLQLT
jgi:hypothetical protein